MPASASSVFAPRCGNAGAFPAVSCLLRKERLAYAEEGHGRARESGGSSMDKAEAKEVVKAFLKVAKDGQTVNFALESKGQARSIFASTRSMTMRQTISGTVSRTGKTLTFTGQGLTQPDLDALGKTFKAAGESGFDLVLGGGGAGAGAGAGQDADDQDQGGAAAAAAAGPGEVSNWSTARPQGDRAKGAAAGQHRPPQPPPRQAPTQAIPANRSQDPDADYMDDAGVPVGGAAAAAAGADPVAEARKAEARERNAFFIRAAREMAAYKDKIMTHGDPRAQKGFSAVLAAFEQQIASRSPNAQGIELLLQKARALGAGLPDA